MTWPAGDGEAEPEPGFRIRPYLQDPIPAAGPDPEPVDPGTAASPDGTTPGLRPFVLTAGRVTGADPAIGLETQVTARYDELSEPCLLAGLAPEMRAIVGLCVEPLSVAEISARLRLHLGVTKILVGDLRAAGHLDVHISDVEDAHDPDLILRVIHGLRAIS